MPECSANICCTICSSSLPKIFSMCYWVLKELVLKEEFRSIITMSSYNLSRR
uniref:Uncharacterized protein n=1 Tax=Anguilla anguilla TaxID=7936 RepID=A0A0E9WCR4_ANGAN